MGRETIEIRQVILGMRPYVLIEADTDPADGELVLKIEAGGGAAEQIGALPMMMLMELPAEGNPLVMAIADVLDQGGEYETLRKLAEYIGLPMPGTAPSLSSEAGQ